MQNKINSLTKKYLNTTIKLYKDIHKNPELSKKEYQTSSMIYEILKYIGLDVLKNIGGTGVVGLLKGGKKGKTIGIRCEMDALPILESNEIDFKSENKGVMHACGHDIHMSTLIGVAMMLLEVKDKIHGDIKFIFQPAEERGGGAKLMIKDGVLENPKIDALLGMHVTPYNTGEIHLGFGNILATSCGIYIKVKGKKAHSSRPYEGADAILASSQIITSLHTIISRNLDPFDIATFSIGTIEGGTASNIIADRVVLKGIMRTLNNNAKLELQNKIDSTSKNIGKSFNVDVSVRFNDGYPIIYNDPEFTQSFSDFVIDSSNNIKNFVNFELAKPYTQIEKPFLIADDFGFFSEIIPSCYFFIGGGEKAHWHTSDFLVDENLFQVSLNTISSFVIHYLNK